ncbi:hypothetical protein BDN72DRAFT_863509 [Pluteus cervinus]|uniref:Uncharacterized protein n=1 Tax=Pluteus cervinus TaxID=181527 RepID=A0ACD3A831_9AGAR|nr:hypothetical protein BDN72DRAFT_863509 [Pluteus cervinus]
MRGESCRVSKSIRRPRKPPETSSEGPRTKWSSWGLLEHGEERGWKRGSPRAKDCGQPMVSGLTVNDIGKCRGGDNSLRHQAQNRVCRHGRTRKIGEKNLPKSKLCEFSVMAARSGEWILGEWGLKRPSPRFAPASEPVQEQLRDQDSSVDGWGHHVGRWLQGLDVKMDEVHEREHLVDAGLEDVQSEYVKGGSSEGGVKMVGKWVNGGHRCYREHLVWSQSVNALFERMVLAKWEGVLENAQANSKVSW